MRRILLKAWLVAAVGLPLATAEKTHAEVPALAKDRAALYQAEVAKVLWEYHWRIIQNRPGRLTVAHAAARAGAAFADPSYDPGPSGMGSIILYLAITFRSETAASTRCLVQITGYFATGKDKAGKLTVDGPYDANSPENERFVREKLADAEKRMLRKHPEYAAR